MDVSLCFRVFNATKAGKGRTGVIIASWLQFNNEWPDADKALAFYAAARTYNQKGVTIPSQIRYFVFFLFLVFLNVCVFLRYVRYFGTALRRKGGFSEPPSPKTIMLKEIILRDFVSPGELKFLVQAHGISTEPSLLRTWKDVGTTISAPASRKVNDFFVLFLLFMFFLRIPKICRSHFIPLFLCLAIFLFLSMESQLCFIFGFQQQ
jgi:hypothetical protein